MRSIPSSGACLAALAAVLLPACASGGTVPQPNGPVYTLDGGSDVTTDHRPDGGHKVDAVADSAGDAISLFGNDAQDGSSTGDASVPGDAGLDGPGKEAAPPSDATSPTDGTPPTDAPPGDATDAARPADAPPPPDASDAAPPVDAAPPSDAGVCPSGSGSIAILGGTSTGAFGWATVNGGAATQSALSSTPIAAPGAIVPYGTGFLGVYPSSSSDTLESVVYSGGSSGGWGTPSPIPAVTVGGVSATAIGSPSLVASGSSAEVVYDGSNSKFYDGVFSGGAWAPASDEVGAVGDAGQGFGPSAPAATASGGQLYVAWDGQDHGLYVVASASLGGAWGGTKAISGAGTGEIPPTLVPLSGGAADVLLISENQSSQIYYSLHTPSADASDWSAALVVNGKAFADTQVSVAPLANGGAVMVYLGLDGLAYSSFFSPGASPAWTVPVELFSTTLTMTVAPVVAPGVCGYDAVAVVVAGGVGMELVTLQGQTWAAPLLVSGTSSVSYATVATAP